MSDLHDRFEKLARRGTVRGADAVLADARRQVEGTGALASVDRDAAADDDAPPVVSLTNLEPASTMRRRRRMGSLVAAGGVAASLFVGVLAIGSLTGNGSGADSPEGAVRQLAAAVAHEDALAAADVLAPEEVRSLSSTVDAAAKKAQELALAENASAPLTGLDLSVDGLNLSTESLAGGYAKVTVAGGTISARTDKGRFSPLMQRALRNSENNSAQADLATLGRDNDLPTFVVTVQRDGHWYVSAAYTALEYIRVANDLPPADFGSGRRVAATLGAGTPDAAVSDAVHALADGDWQRLIALAPPDELPVYDYRAALTQLAADSNTNPNFTVDKLETSSTVSGDTAKVVLTASGTVPPSDGDQPGTWSVTGSCFVFPQYDLVSGSDGSQGSVLVARQPSTCGLHVFSIVPYVNDSAGNGASTPITAVRENGRWFVSPVGTVLDLVDNAIKSLTRRTLYTMLNIPDQLPPDGTLALGQPVKLTPTAAGPGAFVYSFDGHAGEHLLGLATTPSSDSNSYGFFTEVRAFAPDGTELDDASGMLNGQSLTLPATGTYKFVVQTYSNTETTFTIFDAAQAPEAAKHPQYPDYPSDLGSCASTIVGETCSKSSTATSVPSPSSTSATPTTVAGG